jgi:ectoine hydroxylase-related dioxygenase (phytanoyl-CoA dioxygenase family)
VNYVYYATRHSDLAHHVVHTEAVVSLVRALLGSDTWLLDHERFGVVYQDSRPGAESAYSRIGWHTDRQSGPHLAIWPSIAFTVHLDGTSPANGFLRVVPGSHRRTTDGLPPAFEPVAGEVALYARRGDVLLHHCDLWHSAARATEDPPGGVRRHLRGGWYTGEPLAAGHGVADFVKNAQR